MQQILLPLFYNLQQIIRASDFHRKYHLIFQSLDLAAVRDTNTGIGRTEVERYFARLGDREVEQTTHYKMRAVRNNQLSTAA